jgi:ribose transport system substrate-binding protein
MKKNQQRKTLTLVTIILLVCAAFIPITASAKDKIRIGWSNAGMGDSWREFLVANFKAEVAKHPEITKYYITNADEKVDKQIADIESLIVKNIDVLIIYPTVGDALIPVIERTVAEGIPVVVFGGTINTDKMTSLVKQDLIDLGAEGANWLANELGGKGKIVMMSGIAGNTTAEDRLEGARQAFKNYPGIEILDHQYCDWSPPKARSIMETMIQAFPEIDGIWADSGLMSWPALQALKDAGRPLPPTTGDQLNGFAKFLMDHKVRGYIAPMTTRLSGEAVKVAVKVAKGDKVDKVVSIKFNGFGPDEVPNIAKPDLSDWWWVGDDNMPEEFLPKL